jgi:branched-chain amino acid aminotransferase
MDADIKYSSVLWFSVKARLPVKNDIDWKNIGFSYRDTGTYVQVECKGGSWDSIRACHEPFAKIHIAATCLHYGQECFEGMKAFTRKDGTVAIFRPRENAQRLINSALRLCMQPPSVELFTEAVREAIKLNMNYVPPYGTGASLYIRPLLIGTSPCVGVQPSQDYLFIVIVMPVGPYYKNGFVPIRGYVHDEYDRASPHGVGDVKVGGNYASALKPDVEAKKKGYPISLYLDSSDHLHIDEFGTSNFIGITGDRKYVTPASSSILPSITNRSLEVLARDFGMTVERRPVRLTELRDFIEVGACGTAAVITPVYSLTYKDTVYTFGREDQAGETLTRLYHELQGIQYGEMADRHSWCEKL